MSDYQINLNVPEIAYMFGFLQADGHLYANTRNRGRLSLELNAKDGWIVEQFARLVPFHSSVRTRTRTTNFGDNHHSVIWSVHSRDFRDALIGSGFTAGKKSDIMTVPQGEFAQTDYYRGIVDADGSVGITADGFPFVSIVTASENLAVNYLAYIYLTTGCRKKTERNTRDRVFNITVYKEEAQALAAVLYYEGCLALPRKSAKAVELTNWQRPLGMRKVHRQVWSQDQDEYILTHTLDESALYLERSVQSVKMRLWRLASKEVTERITS